MKETRTVKFHYPLEHIKEPIVTRLVTDFDILPNLLRADVDATTGGWMTVALEGDSGDIDRALTWVGSHGVDVTAAE